MKMGMIGVLVALGFASIQAQTRGTNEKIELVIMASRFGSTSPNVTLPLNATAKQFNDSLQVTESGWD